MPATGYLSKLEPGTWSFRPCDGGGCPNDANLCADGIGLTFGPVDVEPPEHLDGHCVMLSFALVADMVSQECHARWVAIQSSEGERLLYLAGWSLQLGVDGQPFQSIVEEAKCHCEGYDVECCAEKPDPGPQYLRVTPPEGEAFPVYMGQTHHYDVTWAQEIVRYEFGNHRSFRMDCESPSVHEWFVRDVAG